MGDAFKIDNLAIMVIVALLVVMIVGVVMMTWITAHDLLSHPCGGPS